MLEILRAKQTEQYPVGEWYLGALIALTNQHNPERLAHAGNSLRELLENIPKWTGVEIQKIDKSAYDAARNVVIDGVNTCKTGDYQDGWKGEITPPLVKTMVSLEAYLKLSEGPNRHENTAQGIANSNPLYKYTDQEDRQRSIRRLRKCSATFQKFTHHAMSTKHEAVFLKTLAETEALLAEIFNPSAVDVQTAIRAVVKKDPSEIGTQQLNGIFDLIVQRPADYDFFFRNLEGTKWIQPLNERGFFRAPPSVKDAGGGFVQLPSWLPLTYLVRVAHEAAAEVISICLNIPPTDNIRVYGEIHRVALAVPDIEMSIALASKIEEGIPAKYHLLGDGYHKLLARWAGHDASVNAALALAKKLLRFRPDPLQEEKLTRRKSDSMAWDTILDPQPQFDSWEYHQVLSGGVIPLACRAPLETSLLLIECLVEFLQLKIHEWQLTLEEAGGEDYSSVWCKRVDGPVGEYIDPDEALIHTMTAACEECCRHDDPQLAIKVNAALKEVGWKIFERVRHHLYAKYPAIFRDQIREDILSYSGYAEIEYDREQADMIRNACLNYGRDLFSPEEYDRIVDTILNGPMRDDEGENESDERFARRRDWMHRQQLWPFESILRGAGLARFKEANISVTEEATINGYSPIDTGGVHEIKSETPSPADELGAKSDEELIQFLNEWDQSRRSSANRWVTIDREGPAGAFAKCISNDTNRFAKWDKQWDLITRPIFLRAAIDCATMQVEAKNYQGIEGWFRLCHVILAKHIPLDVDTRELSDESDSSPRWERPKYDVQAFAEACLKPDSAFPLPFISELSSIVTSLCTGPDSTLDQHASIFRESGDPIGTAINTNRGRALNRLQDLVIWLRARGTPDLAEKARSRFASVLDARFEGHPPLTEPEYAFLALSYRRLRFIDKDWLKTNHSRIFPQDDIPLWRATFGSLLRYTHSDNGLYDSLEPEYRFALEQIESFRKDAENNHLSRDSAVSALGQHLFIYYIFGRYPLTGESSLIATYAEHITVKESGALFKNVGAILKNWQALPPDFVKRAQDFLEWRIAAAEAHPHEEPTKELAGFYGWLSNDQLPAEWRLRMFIRVLEFKDASDTSALCVDCLLPLITDHLALVMECFAKLTTRASNPVFFIQADVGRKILAAGFSSPDPKIAQNAKVARENLVAAGRAEFLD